MAFKKFTHSLIKHMVFKYIFTTSFSSFSTEKLIKLINYLKTKNMFRFFFNMKHIFLRAFIKLMNIFLKLTHSLIPPHSFSHSFSKLFYLVSHLICPNYFIFIFKVFCFSDFNVNFKIALGESLSQYVLNPKKSYKK